MFARIGRLFRGFLGLFISGIEEANPEALMEAARSEFRQKMTQYNLALARMAGVAERLKGQVKVEGGARAGARAPHPREPPRRQHGARRHARARAAGAQRPISAPTRAELKETEEAYDANLRQAKLAQREFEDKVRRVEKQLSQVKIKEAQAEAAAALSNVAFKVGDLGDTMKTVEDILREALRSVGRQGARRARHGRHGEGPGEGERAEGARAGRAGGVPGEPGHPGNARR